MKERENKQKRISKNDESSCCNVRSALDDTNSDYNVINDQIDYEQQQNESLLKAMIEIKVFNNNHNQLSILLLKSL